MRDNASAPTLVGVLDLGTGVDPVAAGLAGTARAGASGRIALQWVRAATLLTARTTDGCVEVTLCSRDVEAMGEDELIQGLSEDLSRLHDGGGTLVTYNGRRHDLPILRRRLARHMLFGSDGVRRWLAPGSGHIDLMTDIQPSTGKWSSLQDEAAGLGIAMPIVPAMRGPTASLVQCEVDCAVTYLVHLHLVAGRTGDAAAFLAGWRGLAAAVDQEPARLTHLHTLRRPAGLPHDVWQILKLSS